MLFYSVQRRCPVYSKRRYYVLKLLRAHEIVQRSTSASTHGCEHFEHLPPLKRLVGFHISHRQTTPEGFPPPRRAQPSVSSRTTSDLTELVEATDDKLFWLIIKDNHILSSLLPPKSGNRYNLGKKHHNRELLPKKNTDLFDCNFIVRLLYKYCY